MKLDLNLLHQGMRVDVMQAGQPSAQQGWCTCGGVPMRKLAGKRGLQSGSCPGLQQTSRAPTCMPEAQFGSAGTATHLLGALENYALQQSGNWRD